MGAYSAYRHTYSMNTFSSYLYFKFTFAPCCEIVKNGVSKRDRDAYLGLTVIVARMSKSKKEYL